MSAPILKTDRLTLRPHRMDDLGPFWDFFTSPRARYVDGPAEQKDLWYWVASDVGSWSLQGHGGWAIETADGAFAGQVAISKPPHFPELELGWLLFDGFERQGIALEAASAARDFAFRQIPGCTTLVSYIDRDNARSIRLAERLGAVLDPYAERYNEVDVVYRHSKPEHLT